MTLTAREPQRGAVDARVRTERSRLRALAQVLLAAGLVALFVFVGQRVYHFSNPAAVAFVAGDRPFYIDIVTRVPYHTHLALLVLGIVLSWAGPGAWLLAPLRISWRDEIERLLFGLMAGMAALTFTTLVLGWAQQIYPAPLLAVVAVCAVVTLLDFMLRARKWRAQAAVLLSELRGSGWRVLGSLCLAAGLLAFIYLTLLGALSPEVQFDATWYHLAVPEHYALHGGLYDIVRLTRMTPAGYQPYQDLLYTFLIPLVGLIGAKILHWVDALLAVAVIIYFCRTWFASLAAGLLAGLIFIGLPVVAWSASTGSNDLPQAFLTLLCLHGFLRWRQTRSWRWLAVAAVSAGYAVGFKISALAILIPFLVAIALASWLFDARGQHPLTIFGRGIGHVIGAGAIVGTICAPWLFRSYQLTGDPVFPALNRIFKSPYLAPGASGVASNPEGVYGHQQTLLSLLRLPWDTAVHGYEYRSIIGPVFLVMTPLAVWSAVTLRGRMRRRFLFLGAFALAAILLWYATAQVEIRYVYGAVAVLCVLVAASVLAPVRDWSGWVLRASGMALLLVMVTLNSQLLVPYQPDSIKPSIAGRSAIDFPYLYGHTLPPPAQPAGFPALPRTGPPKDPMLDYLNTHLSVHDKVYVTTILLVEYLYAKPDFYNGFGGDSPVALGQWTLESPDAYRQLRAVGVDYVLLSTQQVPAIMQARLGPYLRMVYEDGQGQVLFRLEPLPTRGASRDFCRPPSSTLASLRNGRVSDRRYLLLPEVRRRPRRNRDVRGASLKPKGPFCLPTGESWS